MSDNLMNSVASRWARLGVMLNVNEASRTPDIERLLLDSACVASANTRIFVLAASWLAKFGDYVAKHRLARMIGDDLDVEHRATLGFLLEWAKENGEDNTSRFNLAIDACRSPIEAKPLAEIERRNSTFSRLAEQRASALSRKWGRWMSAFDRKDDALRPSEWVAEHNPALLERALTGGDLIASVLAECEASSQPIESEAELARRCGASRPAVRDAVRRLQMAHRIKTVQHGRNHRIQLMPRVA